MPKSASTTASSTAPRAPIRPVQAPEGVGSGRVHIIRAGCGSVILLLQPSQDISTRYYHPCTTQTQALRWMVESCRNTFLREKGGSFEFKTADVLDFFQSYKDIMLLCYDTDIHLFKVFAKDKILNELRSTCDSLGSSFCTTNEGPKEMEQPKPMNDEPSTPVSDLFAKEEEEEMTIDASW